MPGSVLGTRVTTINRTDMTPDFMELASREADASERTAQAPDGKGTASSLYSPARPRSERFS